MDTQIDRRFKRAWDFFTTNAASLVLGTLIVCLGFALVIPGPWVALNLLGEINDALDQKRPVKWKTTYERTSTFLPAWGLAAVMTFGIAVGLMMCVVPGVLLAIAWFHAATFVARGTPVFQALADSFHQLRRPDDYVATLLNSLIIVACALACSFSAVFTVIALPLAMAYLALCTLESAPNLPPSAVTTVTLDATA